MRPQAARLRGKAVTGEVAGRKKNERFISLSGVALLFVALAERCVVEFAVHVLHSVLGYNL